VIVALALVASALVAPRPSTVVDVPPKLDAFLSRVAAVLPAGTRLLVAAQPPAAVYYRATAALLAHRVYSFFPTDYAHGVAAGPAPASALMRTVHHDAASYLLLWGLLRRTLPSTIVVLSAPDGVLLKVTP